MEAIPARPSQRRMHGEAVAFSSLYLL